MSGFEGSAEAAWLNGAIGKRAGLIQGRNEGAAIGYEAGWDDGVAEGQQQAARAAQADSMRCRPRSKRCKPS
jgi:flagellar biosynthesis/type III secretory pathway protein FliH